MKELKLFIKALEQLTPNTMFIPKYTTTATKFGGIKTCDLELWRVCGGENTLITKNSVTARMVTEHEIEVVNEQLAVLTIKQVLENSYGIQ